MHAGVREVEPAMLWNPAVLAGVGVVDDHNQLYQRMHSYLQAAGIDGVKVHHH
jgi:raffinose synthase